MNRIELLLLVAARIQGLAESNLVDYEIALRRSGCDDDEVQAALEEARALSHDGVREAVALVEAMLDEEGIERVRRVAFTDRSTPTRPIVH